MMTYQIRQIKKLKDCIACDIALDLITTVNLIRACDDLIEQMNEIQNVSDDMVLDAYKHSDEGEIQRLWLEHLVAVRHHG